MFKCIDCGEKKGEYAIRCKKCANIFKNKNKTFRKKVSKALKNRVFTKEWKENLSINHADFSGKNNPNWKGGKSFEPYPPNWTKFYKEQIRYRDKYICQVCKKTEIENNRKLGVHHIDYDKNNISPENLIPLCTNCHSETNHNREYWEKYFIFNKKDILNKKVGEFNVNVRLYRYSN